MGVYYETIPDSLVPWILEQQMLWVGTAPLSGDGHINISPKGGQRFGVLDKTTFWYMDLTGSGVETHAHLYEPGNGRICVMFMAFTGPPRILRLYGHARPLEHGTPLFNTFVTDHKIDLIPGSRSIIMVDVHQVATSCGFSVPYYDFVGHRDILDKHFEKKAQKYEEKGDEKESMDYYWAWKSARSIDGLPGMRRGVEYGRENGVVPLKKMVGPLAPEVRGLLREGGERVGPLYFLLFLVLGIVIGVAGALSLVSPEGLRVIRERGKLVF